MRSVFAKFLLTIVIVLIFIAVWYFLVEMPNYETYFTKVLSLAAFIGTIVLIVKIWKADLTK
jgi:hypothetical protein